jgi:hypothetical protein
MRRFLLSVAAVVVSLALVATAEAGPKGNGSGSGVRSQPSHSRPYHEEHGTKFKGGYFYKGKDHHHWTYRYWWGKYGCYTYYCPSTSCWYYWYPQDNCYYPCSYVSSATPVFEPRPVGVDTEVKQIVNVTNNSPGSSTAGAGSTGAPLPPAPPAPPK